MFTRMCNRHDHAVAVDYSSPHVKAKSTIVGLLCLSKYFSQSFTGWKAVFRHWKPHWVIEGRSNIRGQKLGKAEDPNATGKFNPPGHLIATFVSVVCLIIPSGRSTEACIHEPLSSFWVRRNILSRVRRESLRAAPLPSVTQNVHNPGELLFVANG